MNNWIKIEDKLPPKNVLVLIKRNIISDYPYYLGMRNGKEISTNNDASQNCYWYGTSQLRLNAENESQFEFKFESNFSDVTVDSWKFIDLTEL